MNPDNIVLCYFVFFHSVFLLASHISQPTQHAPGNGRCHAPTLRRLAALRAAKAAFGASLLLSMFCCGANPDGSECALPFVELSPAGGWL